MAGTGRVVETALAAASRTAHFQSRTEKVAKTQTVGVSLHRFGDLAAAAAR